MADPTGRVAFERKQMLKVRAALLDGLKKSDQDADLSAFFESCGAYLLWAQQRLFLQDQTIYDLLDPRVPETEGQAHRLLGELNDGLETCRGLAATYKAAVEDLRGDEQAGQDAFRAATEHFFDEAVRAMPGGRNPLERWTEEHFTPQDWETVVHLNDEVIAEEERLFAAVVYSAPEGIDPASYEVFHPKALSSA